MLTELLVHNLAVIRELELSLDAGLNIVSGETGAGKSILVGAVSLLLGGRASQEMVRTGAAEATVQGIFSLSNPLPWNRKLESLGIPPSDRLTVRRSIHRNGRNRVFVNDRMVSVQQLQQLARGLASISGQHEHQILLDPEIHLSLLDQFGGLDAQVAKVGALFSQWSQHREALHRLRRSKEERADRADFVRFQLQELLSAKLHPEEDRTLEHELNLLKHAAALNDAAKSAYEILYSGRGAVVEQLAFLEKNLDTLVRIDPGRASF
ncbi:MAG TPA: AAA family ATPase, partial [Syntrophobacteraceae bacterium]|nr:AAA family ATPase [Syntrophobacteraceae bacterium]